MAWSVNGGGIWKLIGDVLHKQVIAGPSAAATTAGLRGKEIF